MNLNTITIGGGCFWCTEAIMQRVKGVEKVIPGYSNGNTSNPSYSEVCTGSTGHAEVIQVHYNPDIISLETLLTIFMFTHNPTTLNRQGADKGTQYRSIITIKNDEEKVIAQKVIDKMSAYYDNPIVTELDELVKFYPAEDYHHDYYAKNPSKGYCAVVISPKITKLKNKFSEYLK